MRFTETELPGVWIVDVEPHEDHRGSFARAWSAEEFAARGLPARLLEVDHSYSHRAGTLRGLHFTNPPRSEPKFVRCLRGATQEVVVDVRAGSSTFGRHILVQLTADSQRAVFIPNGLAQGHQTLRDDTLVQYLMSEAYAPGYEGGVRYDDPAFGIEWPLPVTSISDRDRSWPDFDITTARGSDS